MKFVAILLYLWLGRDAEILVKLEQVPYKSMEECILEGRNRTLELAKDPSFLEGLYAGCTQMPALEAKEAKKK